MSEAQVLTQEQEEAIELKQRLDQMGVKYHHKANLETLRKLLNERLNPTTKGAEVTERLTLMQEATKLIRCHITCMNPAKRDWQGEIFTAGNSVIGTIRKFIPYNCEAAESWHVPQILLNAMRDRKFLQTRSIKTKSGATQETYMAQEFVIVELPQLTQAELKELADEQAANRGR